MAKDMIAMRRAYAAFKGAFNQPNADLVEVTVNAFLDVTDDEVEAIRAELDPNADPVRETIAALIKRAQGEKTVSEDRGS